VTLKNGTRPAKDFDKYDEGVKWIADQVAKADTEHLPELKGPKQASLAQALAHYAALNTITKDGYESEINRINHYLLADGIKPLLIVCKDDKRELIERPQNTLPSAFAAHRDDRLLQRKKTYELIASLARRKCSTLCTADFRRLMVTMEQEGLSGSTIQKEIALLKHLFNVAAKEWNWLGFMNPCAGLKLSGSKQRFVFMTPQQHLALREALAQCDNPYFWPLVEICLQTTLRKGSLLAMTRTNVDINGRVAMLPGKNGTMPVALSLKAIQLLKGAPVHPSGRYFPMTSGAVESAWEGVREKINMPELQFKDLRHIGATEYARAGANSHQLQKLLGHKSTRMAEVYVNLVSTDTLDFLDRVAPTQLVYQIPQPATGTGEEILKRNRTKRLTAALLDKVESLADPKVLKKQETPDATEHFLATCEAAAETTRQTVTQSDAPTEVCSESPTAQTCLATGTHGALVAHAAVTDNVIKVNFTRRR
jgi:integrase